MNLPQRDLAAELYERIKLRSPECANKWKHLFIEAHPSWATGQLPSVEQQIVEMSDFWRVQLGMMDYDTINLRNKIVDSVSPDIWLQNFERYLMDVVVGKPLPNGSWKTAIA